MMVATALLERAQEIFKPDMPEEFRWVTWLDKRHLLLFAGEFHAAAARNASDAEIEALLDAWKATAEIDRSPETKSQIERNRAGRFVAADEWPDKRSDTA